MIDVRKALAEIDDQTLLVEGFDDAIVGYALRCGQPVLAVYDQRKCVDILMRRDGMTREDAEEFFDFNVLGAWVGDRTPLFLYRLDEGETP